jgi:hypothetical protein
MKTQTWAELLEMEVALDLLRGEPLPLRICANGANGYPIICSLWFKYEEERLYCATNSQAFIAKYLRIDPKCTFEISTNTAPYSGIRGQAVARILPNGIELLESLLVRYIERPDPIFAKWLLNKGRRDVIVELEAKSISCWDYKSRMRIET